MLGGQYPGHPFPGVAAVSLRVAADLCEEHVYDKELGDPRCHRPQLQRALVGAALEDDVGEGGSGVGEKSPFMMPLLSSVLVYEKKRWMSIKLYNK